MYVACTGDDATMMMNFCNSCHRLKRNVKSGRGENGGKEKERERERVRGGGGE